MKPTDITPLVITYNEEANLDRTLGSLRWAEEIVVVDSFSTDGTKRLLERYPKVRILSRHFDSFAGQCNFGLSQITTPWVLSLDADYVCSEEFIAQIAAMPVDSPEDGFQVPFRYCIDGRPLRGTLYPPRTVLYRREAARYEDDGHSHHVRIRGAVGRLPGPILHDDRKPLSSWLASQERYANRELTKLRTTQPGKLGRVDRLRRLGWIVPLLTPWYCLIAKRLLLDGRAGLVYTFQRTYAELLLALKVMEARACGTFGSVADARDALVDTSAQDSILARSGEHS